MARTIDFPQCRRRHETDCGGKSPLCGLLPFQLVWCGIPWSGCSHQWRQDHKEKTGKSVQGVQDWKHVAVVLNQMCNLLKLLCVHTPHYLANAVNLDSCCPCGMHHIQWVLLPAAPDITRAWLQAKSGASGITTRSSKDYYPNGTSAPMWSPYLDICLFCNGKR